MDCVVSRYGISLPVTVALPFPILTGFPVNPRPSVGHQRVNCRLSLTHGSDYTQPLKELSRF